MPEETVTTTGTVPEVVEAAPVQVAPEQTELEAVKEKLSRYEQLVVSPEYAEYLATRTAQKVSDAQQTAPRTYNDAERQAFEERLNSMSRAEYAAFIRDVTVDTVKTQLFAPVVNTMVTEKVQTQIATAATKFPDFWDYKQEMIGLANVNPALTAEQAYHLAKSTKAPAPKAPPRRAGGEPPSSAPATRTEKPIDSFNAAFEAAYKKAGL
jgi:hypothetical protein